VNLARGLALVLLLDGCVLSADGELPEVEITQHGLTIPGVPRESRGGEPTFTLPTFVQPNDHLGLSPEQYRSVKVKSVELSLRGGSGDLSFVRSLRISLSGLRGFLDGLTPTEVARYQRPSNGPVGSTITARKGEPVEVGSAWRDSLTALTIEASGDLPEDAWTFDLTVRASAVIQY
jgi:hypothetical protein